MLIFPTFEEKLAKIIFKSIPSELEVVVFHKCSLIDFCLLSMPNTSNITIFVINATIWSGRGFTAVP